MSKLKVFGVVSYLNSCGVFDKRMKFSSVFCAACAKLVHNLRCLGIKC